MRANLLPLFVGLPALLGVGSLGCERPEEAPGAPPTQANAREPAEVEALLAEARAEPVRASGGRFEVRSSRREGSPRAAIRSEVDPASGGLTLRGGLEDTPIEVRRLNGQPPREARTIDGALALTGVSQGVDARVFARPDGVEDLLVVHEPGAELGYEVDLPQGWRLTRDAEQVVELVDPYGSPRLKVVAARAWDATGARVSVSLRVRGGSTIVADVESKGAVFPLYVDPELRVGGAPAFERTRHTLTATADGRVVMAGGGTPDCDEALPVEAFDVRTMRFDVLGEAVAARCEHTATLLMDGGILLAGGTVDADGGAEPVGLVEVIDAETGAVEASAELASPRSRHTATRLRDGRVLIVGGDQLPADDEALPTATTEVWDPVAGALVAGPPLSHARAEHTATLLPDGRVLVAGGTEGPDRYDALKVAELFDPATETWTLVEDDMVSKRTRHAATALHDGRVLIWGGRSAVLSELPAEVFDPATQTFDALSWDAQAPSEPGSVPLPSGKLLTRVNAKTFDPYLRTEPIFGASPSAQSPMVMLPFGRVFSTDLGGGAVAETRESDELFTLSNFGGYDGVEGVAPRGDHTATLLRSGRVLLAGGHHSDLYNAQITLPQAQVQEVDPVTDSIVNVGPMGRLRFHHSATLLADGRVLIVGGASPAGGDNRVAELYDPATQSFTDSDRVDVDRARHTATLLPSGDVLIVGGDDEGLVERFAVASEAFEAAGELVQPRSWHTATRLLDGRVLIAGGGSSLLELFDPASGAWDTAGTLEVARSGHVASLLPDGSVLFVGGLEGPGPGAEIWDPATGASREPLGGVPWFLPTGPGGQAVALASGDVLVCVPLYDAGAQGNREGCALFRPTLDAFAALPSNEYYGRPGGTMTRALDGGLVRAGYYDALHAWGVDRAISRWRLTPSLAATPELTAFPAPLPAGASGLLLGEDLLGRTEATNGTTFNAAANHPVAIWMPAGEGIASWGAVTAVDEESAVWRVPETRFPGPGSLILSTAGGEGRAVAVTVLGAALGTSCTAPHACASGFCVDGVCCDSACGGCEACSAASKAEGPDGECGPLPAGATPADDATCPAQPLSECGRTGVCDGLGACAFVAEGTPCLEGAVCSEGECVVLPPSCEGDKLVSGDGQVVDCAPYRCTDEGPTCLTTCESALDCVQGSICSADGTCATVEEAPPPSPGCAVRGARRPSWLATLAALGLLARRSGQRARRALAGAALGATLVGCGSDPTPPVDGGGGGGVEAGGAATGGDGEGGTLEPPATCGNGIREGAEACDAADLGGATCEALGLDGGTPHCRHDCTLDVTACLGCGNGYVEPGEECDGDATAGGSCVALADPDWVTFVQQQTQSLSAHFALTTGTPACAGDCTLEPASCGYCLDGVINGTEACDAGPFGSVFGSDTCTSVSDEFVGGDLLCALCELDTNFCVRATPPPCELGDNCSLVLGGTAVAVELPYGDAFALEVQTLTIEGWFRHDDLASGHRFGVSRYALDPESPSFGEWGLIQERGSPDALSLYARRPSQGPSNDPSDHWTIATAYNVISEDVWFHVAGVFDREQGELRLYVDGMLAVSEPFELGGDVWPRLSARILSEGEVGGGGPASDQGVSRVDEVRISSVARYDADFTPELVFEPDADTLALYHFDEAAGDVGSPLTVGWIADSSGNGRTGQINNGAWSGEHP